MQHTERRRKNTKTSGKDRANKQISVHKDILVDREWETDTRRKNKLKDTMRQKEGDKVKFRDWDKETRIQRQE